MNVPSPYQPFYDYLAAHVVTPFYEVRLNNLRALRLQGVLKRKNPYLFKAKNIEIAGDLVQGIVDAFLSSQEETLFGNLLEGFAIHVSHTLYGGFKSGYKSVDLEFERDGTHYIVGIKSGTAWGNADQIAAMKTNFKNTRQALQQAGLEMPIVAVNGCIYGKDARPEKTDADPDKSYFKYAGQDFWRFLSEDDNLYQEIIAPLDAQARVKDEAFKAAYAAKVNEMTAEFVWDFTTNGAIDWLKLVNFVSRRADI